LQFLDEHLERFGNAGLHHVLAFDDRFVGFHATHDVVGFDREQLLQRVRGTVGFQRPDFHFAEALAAELCLAAQRLLRDHRVRTRRTRVDLVVHKVGELQHVDHADGDRTVEAIAAAPVAQPRLAVGGQDPRPAATRDVLGMRAVEDRRRDASRASWRPIRDGSP
jgi:hypothetical protein